MSYIIFAFHIGLISHVEVTLDDLWLAVWPSRTTAGREVYMSKALQKHSERNLTWSRLGLRQKVISVNSDIILHKNGQFLNPDWTVYTLHVIMKWLLGLFLLCLKTIQFFKCSLAWQGSSAHSSEEGTGNEALMIPKVVLCSSFIIWSYRTSHPVNTLVLFVQV